MINDVMKDAREHMDKTLTSLNHEFASVRTGRASATQTQVVS